MEQREALQHVEPPDQIKKKSFSQSTRAVEQSSDLICFQEPFCFLLSCCAPNGEPAEGSVNPCCATLSAATSQMLDALVWVTYALSLFYGYRRLKADQRLTRSSLRLYWKLVGWVRWPIYGPVRLHHGTLAKLWAKS